MEHQGLLVVEMNRWINGSQWIVIGHHLRQDKIWGCHVKKVTQMGQGYVVIAGDDEVGDMKK